MEVKQKLSILKVASSLFKLITLVFVGSIILSHVILTESPIFHFKYLSNWQLHVLGFQI